uniref:Uncharacterized protein n=1 Tax=Oryza barthii TaxID=65489 RepID=A0A0D3HPM4_9ORYZ
MSIFGSRYDTPTMDTPPIAGDIVAANATAVHAAKVAVGEGKRYVPFESDPANPAVVVWNDTAATPGKDGEPLGAAGSATVAIEASNFIANGVVFKRN